MLRAFDTLSRPVELLSWVRTGFALELAEYSVDLDGGVTVVRTPLSSKTWLSHGYADFVITMERPVYLLPGPCLTNTWCGIIYCGARMSSALPTGRLSWIFLPDFCLG